MSSTWTPPDLDEFRGFLRVLAEMQLAEKIRGKLDPSDVVQQTMMEAHANLGRFAGQSRGELAGWLKSILANVLTDAARALGAAKRDWTREACLDASSARLEAWLHAAHSSPSQRAEKHEQLLHMAQALAQLPEVERIALVLRHCQGWTLTRIAEHLQCSAPTVIAHLERGAEHMRRLMPGWRET